MRSQLGWLNYQTNEYEYTEGPTTDAQAKTYLPQLDTVQGLYDMKRLQGDSILEAMIYVLTAYIGD